LSTGDLDARITRESQHRMVSSFQRPALADVQDFVVQQNNTKGNI